ncbi:hypothetical protein ACH47B_26295 [Rhodococcus sp. NPDC019627]|uniref:hypothetical protein n=1 Tax=unclassified Rhodococcus (in: high G+C Gram-positive bacteria) TaxID=192944 RepID=UPI0033DDBFF8
MATATASEEWDKAAAAVRAAAEELRGSDTAALRTWASSKKLLSRSMWPKVKRELYKQLDIDYDTQRETENATRRQAVAAAATTAPLVELYAAGDERGAFAVLPGPAVHAGNDADIAEAAWYGTFHEKDTIYRDGDQDSADNSAAGKAVFLAGKVRESQGIDAVRLLLHISNPNLDGDRLAGTAAKAGVALELDITETNPAYEYCERPGYQAWQAIRLSDLLVDEEQ